MHSYLDSSWSIISVEIGSKDVSMISSWILSTWISSTCLDEYSGFTFEPPLIQQPDCEPELVLTASEPDE